MSKPVKSLDDKAIINYFINILHEVDSEKWVFRSYHHVKEIGMHTFLFMREFDLAQFQVVCDNSQNYATLGHDFDIVHFDMLNHEQVRCIVRNALPTYAEIKRSFRVSDSSSPEEGEESESAKS